MHSCASMLAIHSTCCILWLRRVLICPAHLPDGACEGPATVRCSIRADANQAGDAWCWSGTRPGNHNLTPRWREPRPCWQGHQLRLGGGAWGIKCWLTMLNAHFLALGMLLTQCRQRAGSHSAGSRKACSHREHATHASHGLASFTVSVLVARLCCHWTRAWCC